MKLVERERYRDALSKKTLEIFNKWQPLLVGGKTTVNLKGNHKHYKCLCT